jgi:hypothetical protein
MKLVHYSDTHVKKLYDRYQLQDCHLGFNPKPIGLWLSVDSCEDNWRSWCESEGFNLHKLTHAYDIELQDNANLLILTNEDELDNFTKEYGIKNDYMPSIYGVNWPAVADKWDGIIITPYIWSRRLEAHTFWYYGWDCASGCVWNVKAIKNITLRWSRLRIKRTILFTLNALVMIGAILITRPYLALIPEPCPTILYIVAGCLNGFLLAKVRRKLKL